MPEKPPLILIADDHDVSRESMASILEAAGFAVIQATDGGAAKKVAEEHEIHAAIVDHHMSPFGGFDFALHVRSVGIDVPLVLITSEDVTDLLLESSRRGFNHFLKKPVEPKRLVETIRRAMKERGIKIPEPSRAIEEFTATNTPEQLMAKAVELARKNYQSKRGGPFGAIVADKNGRVLGEGVNGITSRCDPMAHAEVMAIRKATDRLGKTDLEDCVLYCSSEPTALGQALIVSVGIPQVFFALSHAEVGSIRSQRDQKIGAELSQPAEKRQVRYEKLGGAEAIAMFKDWQSTSNAHKD